MDTATRAIEILGGNEAFRTRKRGGQILRQLVERGLPRRAVEHLVERLPESERAGWRVRLLPREGRGSRLATGVSAEAGRLAYLLALNVEVWGEGAAEREFLVRPNPALEGRSPLDAIKSEWGGRAVEEILRKIQFGLPA